MSCEHDCDRPDVFPLDIHNRPGLARFDYRIGTYARMRAHMLDRLVKSAPLEGWSHLGADEPGIALLEGAAIVGDILTFYQQLYANETKLGTAGSDDTIRDLVRLTGYRPAPGLGGRTRFALEVEGSDPLKVPLGFPIEAQLDGFDQPSIFETDEAVTAYEAFSAFNLYTPRKQAAAINPGTTKLEIVKVARNTAGFDTTLAGRSAAAEEIAEGDRILILTGPNDPHEILVVASIEEYLDRVIIHLEGSIQEKHVKEVSAFRLGRTFRHYGSDLPSTFTTLQENPVRTLINQTIVTRALDGNGPAGDFYTAFKDTEFPLDSEVDDLAPGATIICTGRQTLPETRNFALVRRLARTAQQTVTWANVAAPVSVATLNKDLRVKAAKKASVFDEIKAVKTALQTGLSLELKATEFEALLELEQPDKTVFGTLVGLLSAQQDIRYLRFHETFGPEMILRNPPQQKAGGPNTGAVNFFGTRKEAEALAGRLLLMDDGVAATEEILVSQTQAALAATPKGPKGDKRMWPVQLAQVPSFGADGFDEETPTVTVYGNLVAASEGETQDEKTIGSGDAREAFQTFAIPKPVTRHAEATATPPYEPALEIRVGGRLWSEVETFFGQGAEAEIYVLRQTEDGEDAVQFGDGITGARLPSGRNNVTAYWRTGTGSHGDLAEDAEPKALEKLKPLTGVSMPGPAVEGAEAETMANAQVAAPARMQGLGRLVSLADYEGEALAIPGVVKASASFGAGMIPAIEVRVLTEDESPEAVAAVASALRQADYCRGPRRHSILTTGGRRRWVAASLKIGHDPALKSADIEAAVADALGALPSGDEDPPDGLMALANRQFGQDVHVSQVLAAAHDVSGVIWAEATAFQRLSGLGDDPADVPLPGTLSLTKRLLAQPEEVLVLSALHLSLLAEGVMTDEECAT